MTEATANWHPIFIILYDLIIFIIYVFIVLKFTIYVQKRVMIAYTPDIYERYRAEEKRRGR